MNHRAASRRLSSLLDDLLAPAEEEGVREHLAQCRRCRYRLREFEASEILLRRIPASLIPLDPGATGTARLRGLARWAPPPPARWTRSLPALGAAAAAAVAILLMVSVIPVRPVRPPDESGRRLVLASRGPSSFLAPDVAASVTGVPYTWRQ